MFQETDQIPTQEIAAWLMLVKSPEDLTPQQYRKEQREKGREAEMMSAAEEQGKAVVTRASAQRFLSKRLKEPTFKGDFLSEG